VVSGDCQFIFSYEICIGYNVCHKIIEMLSYLLFVLLIDYWLNVNVVLVNFLELFNLQYCLAFTIVLFLLCLYSKEMEPILNLEKWISISYKILWICLYLVLRLVYVRVKKQISIKRCILSDTNLQMILILNL